MGCHASKHEISLIVRESMESYAQLASDKGIGVRFLPSDFVGEILCDRDRIIQVMSNLIGNAIKFTPRGGFVTIQADFKDSELCVCVHDTGPGIADDQKDKIFERFMQIASNDRRGLGLGLHIAKMLIEAHQGRLWVQSNVGHGSSFYFALPRWGLAAQARSI